MSRIGIFGGTFNPPHLAHLCLAQEAYEQLGLSKVIWVPVGLPPHRMIEMDPGKEARFIMTHLAISKDDRYRLSDTEYRRKGLTYTVDTVEAIAEDHPEAILYLLVGGDQAAALHRWRHPRSILRMANLAVGGRNVTNDISTPLCSCSLETYVVRAEVEQNPEYHDHGCPLRGSVVLSTPPLEGLSSTLLRERVHAGKSVKYLVPEDVEQFILMNRLYR